MQNDNLFKTINTDFSLLCKMVLQQFQLMKQFLELDDVCEKSIEIAHNEQVIDGIDAKIRNEFITTVVLYAPRASNLRKIVAYYDMTAYLERVGDQLVNITEYLSRCEVKGSCFKDFKEDIAMLVQKTENMLQNAIFAFMYKNDVLAHETIEGDDEVDTLYHAIQRKVETWCSGKMLTQQEIADVLSIHTMVYNMERIGDNATNIAESAIFLIDGIDVKHRDSDQGEPK